MPRDRSEKDANAPTRVAPVLPAIRRDGLLVTFCPYCQREHIHGAVGPQVGDGDGLRAAHCPDDASPFKRRGYRLEEVRPVSRVLWVMA
jgi:hypothetical protein